MPRDGLSGPPTSMASGSSPAADAQPDDGRMEARLLQLGKVHQRTSRSTLPAGAPSPWLANCEPTTRLGPGW
eukprot:7487994-Alexandrium_andersonii.AAC.1